MSKLPYKIIEARTKKDLDELYKNSALTIEGLDSDSIVDFAHGGTVDKVVVTEGRLMNKVYGLTGNNAYPKYLTIVSILGDTLPMTMRRFEFGGRWFDDIVDNNARRENDR